MTRTTATVALAVLIMAAPAFAQSTNPPGDPGTMSMGQEGNHQGQMSTQGKITSIDLAAGTVTLDNGMQFTRAPSLQYTSFPSLGQEVQVTYEERGGKNVAEVFDAGSDRSDGGDQ